MFERESSNAHAQTLIGAPHSESASNTLTLPSTGGNSRLVSAASTATLTNKTLTSPVINTGTFGTSILPTSADGTTLGSASKEFSDLFLADSSTIQFGNDQDTTLTHTDGSGLTLNSTNKLMFNDASQFIQGTSATVLSIGATDEIDLTATAVDLNGTLNVSGVATFQAAPVFPDGSIAVADLDIDGATDINAAIVDADLFIVDDGAGGTNRKTTAARVKTYIGAVTTLAGLTDVSMDIANFQNGILIQTGSDGSAPTTGTLSTATGNVGIGHNVMKTVTSGDYNVAIGHGAMDALTTGQYNVAIGGDSPLGALDAGLRNIAIGNGALLRPDGENDNVAIGSDTLTGAINGGEKNIAIGTEAGEAVTTGDENTFIGYQSGEGVSTGANNTLIGRNAATDLVSGSNNICIGSGSNVAAGDQSNGIALGSVDAAANDFSFGKASNVVTNDFDADADWSRSSDVRLKTNIESTTLGLDFINDLRPVKFNWKPSYEVPKEMTTEYHKENQKDLDYISHGFIAQEVKEAIDKHGDTTFGGWHVDKVDNETQRVKKNMFIMPLIKAVQELSAEVKELKAKLENK